MTHHKYSSSEAPDMKWIYDNLFSHFTNTYLYYHTVIRFAETPYSFASVLGPDNYSFVLRFFKIREDGVVYKRKTDWFRTQHISFDEILNDKSFPNEIKKIILFNVDLFQ